jgi:hypothetical protein
MEMKTYDSYEAAKIDNPESLICKFGDKFTIDASRFGQALQPCNPADHCMTVEKFLADGHKFVEGDVVLNGTRVKTISKGAIDTMNMPSYCDKHTFILRSAALEEKKPRIKGEYVKCEFEHAWEAVKEHEENKNIFHSIDRDGVIEEFAICGYDMHVIGECARDGELYRRIETTMTEREAFVEALQSVWVVDGVDGKYQFDEIVNSGLFKLVN